MATTKSEMSETSPSKVAFVSSMPLSDEEKEPAFTSINFRESLRFFQEQLLFNSSKGVGADKVKLKVSGKRSPTESFDITKSPDICDEEKISYTSSKIQPIPTVDTILQSVKILRAIQKSQAQRESHWGIDISASDPDVLSTYRAFELGLIKFNDVPQVSQNPYAAGEHTKTDLLSTKLLKSQEIKCCQKEGEKDLWLPRDNGHEEQSNTNNGNRFWPPNNFNQVSDKMQLNGDHLKEIKLPVTDTNGSDFQTDFDGINNISSTEIAFQELTNSDINKDNYEKSLASTCDSNDYVACSLELAISERSTSAEFDSGVGTDKSLDSLSPMRCEADPEKDLWSESFASAEGSPCESLVDVTEDLEVISTKCVLDSNVSQDNLACSEGKEECAEKKTHEESEFSETVCDKETNPSDQVDFRDNDNEDTHATPPPANSDATVAARETADNSKDDHTSKDRLVEVVEDKIEQVHLRTDGQLETQAEPVSDLDPAKVLLLDTSGELSPELSRDQTLDSPTSQSFQLSPGNEPKRCFNALSYSGSETSVNTLDTLLDDDDDEPHRPKRKLTFSWDPIPLLEHLYDMTRHFSEENLTADEETIENYFNILPEGAFDNQSEEAYIVIQGNHMSIYKTKTKQHLLLELPLQYATIEIIDEHVLLLDNRLGKWMKVKFGNDNETQKWRTLFLAHCKNLEIGNVEPVYYPLKCHKDVIIIDLGSCSTRAGILMDQPTFPTLFFPTVCATDKKTGVQHYGIDALLPNVRKSSTLSFPVRSSVKITKFTMDIDALSGLFKMIFSKLQVDPKNYTVQLCIPRSLSTNTQIALVKLLLEDLGVQSVSLTRQALLTMYANNVSTAIVVDIGDRMEILSVVDGFILECGVSKLPFGGQRIFHHMKHALAQKHISLSNDVESFVVQYIFESLCYVAQNYEKELDDALSRPESIRKSLPLHPFFQDHSKLQTVWLDIARFQVPEGLFKPDLWGLDSPGLHKLVHHAILTSGMDVRRKMAENIYVSGGVTLLPGFVERLQQEIAKLTLPRLTPKVHASPHRYHMTYIGACQLALSDMFSQVCITSKEWKQKGPVTLNRWHL